MLQYVLSAVMRFIIAVISIELSRLLYNVMLHDEQSRVPCHYASHDCDTVNGNALSTTTRGVK